MIEENDRVVPPANLSDEEALREYGRQLARDSLMTDLKVAEVIDLPVRKWNRRVWLSASAASVAGMAGFTAWKFGRGENREVEQLVELDPRWILEAAGDAEYLILGSKHVKLLKGELRLTSREPAGILVETLNAKAIAKGSDFLIGCDEPNQTQNDMNKNTITRLLVLAGSVSLATAEGSENAKINEALVAKGDESPEKITLTAHSQFAFDLYAQLAVEDENANLFFSPYSVSNALLMVAEGARGQTALEMGNVLGFPDSLRRSGEGAQSIPWAVGKMTMGQARLNELINEGGAGSPEQVKLREEITKLVKELKVLRKERDRAQNASEWAKRDSAVDAVDIISDRLKKAERNVDTLVLRVASAVWSEKTINLQKPWRETVTESFGVGAVKDVDFKNNPEGARKRINLWVENETEGRVKNLFEQDSIGTDARLVLANAVYFKGDWAVPFSKEATRKGLFRLKSGEATDTFLMNKEVDETVRYAAFNADGSLFETPEMIPTRGKVPQTYPDENGFLMVEMPYQGGEVSMVAIAPNHPTKLSDLEGKLTSVNVARWIASLENRKTNIGLPKFKMESSYKLHDTLAKMGMPSAFDVKKADFTGINTSEDLCIGKVVHKAFFEVNEKGTEATAATGVGMIDGGELPSKVPFIPTFSADRPFIYMIRDQKSGAILFLGRVLDPRG